MEDKEICICAAVLEDDGTVILGHRHGDCIRTIQERGNVPSSSPASQGFFTSRKRFVTRAEGRKLQDDAGIPSASEDGYLRGTLYSEDLY